jgi:hypothetical protein
LRVGYNRGFNRFTPNVTACRIIDEAAIEGAIDRLQDFGLFKVIFEHSFPRFLVGSL